MLTLRLSMRQMLNGVSFVSSEELPHKNVTDVKFGIMREFFFIKFEIYILK